MQFSSTFPRLSLFALALASAVMATPLAAPNQNDAASEVRKASSLYPPSILTHSTTSGSGSGDTYVGAPINPLAPRSAQNTMVTYCNKRVNNVCGGSCTVYNGGAACLDAPGTNCLVATNNVGFCDRAGCGHSCHQLSTCGTHLDNGFCFTPGTQSILVSSA